MMFCVIGENRRTPWLTILLVGVFASLFALIRDIASVAEFTNFAILLAFVGVNASAIKLFRREHFQSCCRHIVLNLLLPILGGVFALFLAANTGWRAAVFGAILLAVGFIIYTVMGIISRKNSGGKL